MNGSDIVFVCGDQRVSRDDFDDRSARATKLLADVGVTQGGCVGIALRNRPQFFELLAATTAIGARAVPIAWRLKHDEIRYLVEDSGATIVIYDDDSASQIAGLPGMSIDEYEKRLAAIPAIETNIPDGKFNLQLYSSGTTGRPKAIERDVPALDKAGKPRAMPNYNFLEVIGVSGSSEVHLICGPLYHSQPIGFGTSALASGHRVVMMEGGFDAEHCLRTIDKERVTWFTCVPTHLIRMLALPAEVRARYDLSSVKAVMHSAAPCPRDIKEAVIRMFPENTVWEVYGGTEGSMSMISPQEWLAKPGSVGRVFPKESELRIMDADGNTLPANAVGLIYARSLLDFRYRNAEQSNKETWRGAFFTLGDVGYLDDDGYLFITDRQKDMIISGGSNVYPAEVEAVLFNHPAVGDASVIGVPDRHWGEMVKAIVEPRAEVSAEDIIGFCRANLAHYKCPTSVDFVDKLPRDPNGKVRKREIREAYWAGAGRAV
jgi:long-chain acyl-CoA synthetase